MARNDREECADTRLSVAAVLQSRGHSMRLARCTLEYVFVEDCLTPMPNDFRWGTLGSLIERVRTGSVLAPLLALAVICGFAAFGVTLRLGETLLPICLWTLFAFCVFATLVGFIGFALKDPDRLQTEDYRLARHRLELIGDERDPNDPKLLTTAPTANTHLEVGHS